MVCRAWYDHCVSIFYQRINVSDDTHFISLLVAAGVYDRVRLLLAATVEVSLRLGPGTLEGYGQSDESTLRPRELFPSLRKLTVHAYKVPKEGSLVWRSFRLVTDLTLNCDVPERRLCHVLCSLPQLRRLVFVYHEQFYHNDSQAQGPHSGAPPAEAKLHYLREVCIDVSNSAAQASITRAIVHSAQLDTIEILEALIGPQYLQASPLSHLLEQVGPSLAHFRERPSLYDNRES